MRLKDAFKITLEMASNQVVGSSEDHIKEAIGKMWDFYKELEYEELIGLGAFSKDD